LWPEVQFVALVTVAGALRSYIHPATSFADYLGNRKFVKSWMWWYVLRPFIGSALAVILYFVARGGLIAGSGGATDLSPYGVTALASSRACFPNRRRISSGKRSRIYSRPSRANAPIP
jgi:hypothetical protein